MHCHIEPKTCSATWWTPAEVCRVGLNHGPEARRSCVGCHTRYRGTPPDNASKGTAAHFGCCIISSRISVSPYHTKREAPISRYLCLPPHRIIFVGGVRCHALPSSARCSYWARCCSPSTIPACPIIPSHPSQDNSEQYDICLCIILLFIRHIVTDIEIHAFRGIPNAYNRLSFSEGKAHFRPWCGFLLLSQNAMPENQDRHKIQCE